MAAVSDLLSVEFLLVYKTGQVNSLYIYIYLLCVTYSLNHIFISSSEVRGMDLFRGN